MSADGPAAFVTVSSVTELIVRELRLRRFDSSAPEALPRAVPPVADVTDSRHLPPVDHTVERLAARHSCRRRRPLDLGL